MKLITRDTDYAIRSICYIAKQKDKVVPVSSLAMNLKIPKPFLRKILQILQAKGILESYKGKHGGFKLALPLNKIFLVDLIQIFKGSFKLNECIFKKKTCPNIITCVLKKKLGSIEKYVFLKLKSITIVSLLRENI
jgi:Rrf2 family protein